MWEQQILVFSCIYREIVGILWIQAGGWISRPFYSRLNSQVWPMQWVGGFGLRSNKDEFKCKGEWRWVEDVLGVSSDGDVMTCATYQMWVMSQMSDIPDTGLSHTNARFLWSYKHFPGDINNKMIYDLLCWSYEYYVSCETAISSYWS